MSPEELARLLQPFCSTKRWRKYLNAPFSDAAFTYATDGLVLVRVARQLQMVGHEKAPRDNAKRLLDGAGFDTALFLDAPVIEFPAPERIECRTCDGRGFEHDCPDCSCECDECDGEGSRDDDCECSIGIGGTPIALRVARRVWELPGLKLGQPPGPSQPWAFTFDGGVGLFMAIKKKCEVHTEYPLAGGAP
jgi:hypothetical protein